MPDLSRAEVETFLGVIADLERRIKALESANRLVGAIPRGGSITVVDPTDGSPLAIIGELVDGVSLGTEFYDSSGDIVFRAGALDGGTRNGIEAFNAAGIRILRADERGSLEPNVHIPFAVIQDVSVNSGTFTTTHKAVVSKMKNPFLHMQIDIDCDSGTTAELRVEIVRVGSPGGTQTSSLRSISSGFLNTVHLYIQVDMVLDAKATIFMEARRVSGAGAVRISMPYGDWGDYTSLATIAGVWT